MCVHTRACVRVRRHSTCWYKYRTSRLIVNIYGWTVQFDIPAGEGRWRRRRNGQRGDAMVKARRRSELLVVQSLLFLLLLPVAAAKAARKAGRKVAGAVAHSPRVPNHKIKKNLTRTTVLLKFYYRVNWVLLRTFSTANWWTFRDQKWWSWYRCHCICDWYALSSTRDNGMKTTCTCMSRGLILPPFFFCPNAGNSELENYGHWSLTIRSWSNSS